MIENLCIQIEFSVTKKINFISIYRPPGNHPLLSVNQQLESFFYNFEELLVNIGTSETYICTDNNNNLLDLNNYNSSKNFFELLTSQGFLNLITKATGFSPHNLSLVDQIISNTDKSEFKSGVLIHDLSDHFFTFNGLYLSKKISKPKIFF